MLSVSFSGWFQCRLARDPDPADEPRGVSGASFALLTEPDLDRIIRLQDPVCERTIKGQEGHPGAVPKVGVTVDSVAIDGLDDPNHPLVGADVDLRGDPKFEGWNNAQAREGSEPIHPFHLQISRRDESVVLLERKDVLHPEGLPIHSLETGSDYLKRRLADVEVNSDEVKKATKIYDAEKYLADRINLLQRAIEDATRLDRLAIQQRIDGLTYHEDDWRTYVLRLGLSARMIWKFHINGPDPIVHDSLGYDWDSESEWPIDFWMGGWDNDALCGFMKGLLHVAGSPAK